MSAERDLADCVGAIYAAVSQSGDWLDVGRRVRSLFNASRVTFRVGDGGNTLMAPEESETAYAAYFRSVDPYATRANRDFAESRAFHLERAQIGAELVPEPSYLRSEYYVDYARSYDMRHMMGGLVGLSAAAPLGLYRGEAQDPFGVEDKRMLETLLPHLQSALQLRQRLGLDAQAAQLTSAVLDTLPAGVICVDAGLKIRFANVAARKYFADRASELCAIRSGPFSGGEVYLALATREAASRLRQIVVSATSGGPGGSIRLVSDDGGGLMALISPVPRPLAIAEFAAEPSAMIVVRPIEREPPPPIEMLCDLFGLSRAEAQVAAALSGGVSAEDVASRRGVSLVTVRTQVRSILAKTECENLRDLERAMASLASVIPRAG